MSVIAADLGHRFDTAPFLFRHISFEILPGTVVAITGPSGSGKSTLLAMLGRSVVPTEGYLNFENVERIAWVFQNPYGVAGRTVLDHVSLPIIAMGERRKAAELAGTSLLGKLQLGHLLNEPFGHLSGGEAQRLMLARALATSPQVILVDEPTAQLDPTNAGAVIDALASLRMSGTSVVVATHDPRLSDVCDWSLELGSRAGAC